MVDYTAPGGPTGLGPIQVLIRGIVTVWVLARVLFFTIFALSLFILGFLGYFTVPFIFIGIALALFIAVNTAMRIGRSGPR